LKREEFPVVLKPDAGQRGAGVRFCEDAGAAAEYLRTHPKPALAQPAHPGPYEAGIFYIRMPGELRGRIFSITDKRFPLIIGDGVHTIRQLIYRHPRFRMQAATFLARHHAVADCVLPAGRTFQLARAGNHCQGTMFCDGSDLLTPQLERAIDEIARRFPEFHFGRFDLRYGDVESFKRGQDFEILELNGITSESSNLYDPSFSLFRAYAVLFRQWQILFRISAANRAKGIRPSRARDILRDIMRYYCAVRPEALSD
jgi:hypothetical protein